MFVRVLYCIFLGLLVALFVGWAMSTWFPTPVWETEYPDVDRYASEPIPPSSDELDLLSPDVKMARVAEYEAERAKFQEWKATIDDLEADFKTKLDKQGVIVALISLTIAVVVTSASLLYSGDLQVIAEGLLLGGIFTLMYSIGWSFARSPNYAVYTVGVSLLVTIAVGYKKFIQKPRGAPAIPEPPRQ